jgi:hypothetical protein
MWPNLIPSVNILPEEFFLVGIINTAYTPSHEYPLVISPSYAHQFTGLFGNNGALSLNV